MLASRSVCFRQRQVAQPAQRGSADGDVEGRPCRDRERDPASRRADRASPGRCGALARRPRERWGPSAATPRCRSAAARRWRREPRSQRGCTSSDLSRPKVAISSSLCDGEKSMRQPGGPTLAALPRDPGWGLAARSPRRSTGMIERRGRRRGVNRQCLPRSLRWILWQRKEAA